MTNSNTGFLKEDTREVLFTEAYIFITPSTELKCVILICDFLLFHGVLGMKTQNEQVATLLSVRRFYI